MEKATKVCELTIYLRSGECISGVYHTPLSTGSTVRPFDAIRTLQGDLLLISDATIVYDGKTRTQAAVAIRTDAIAYIELPESGWHASAQAKSIFTTCP